jgi:polar amino acid transport system substrate-binding protein
MPGTATCRIYLGFCLALVLVGCGEEPSSSQPAAGAAPRQTLTVGTEATFPPFEMRDEKGEFVGFDIDMVRAIARKAGFDVQFKDMGFDALIPALQAGQLDMIASGLSITDERRKAVDFSAPYMNAGIALAVRADEQGIRSADDLKGKVAAVQQGSTGAQATEKLKEQGNLRDIKYYPTVPLAMMELTKGGADVVISDRPTTEAYIAAQGSPVKLLASDLQSDSYGLAVRRGNADLLQKVNKALGELKAEGYLEQLKAKHFQAGASAPATEPATKPAM